MRERENLSFCRAVAMLLKMQAAKMNRGIFCWHVYYYGLLLGFSLLFVPVLKNCYSSPHVSRSSRS